MSESNDKRLVHWIMPMDDRVREFHLAEPYPIDFTPRPIDFHALGFYRCILLPIPEASKKDDDA